MKKVLSIILAVMLVITMLPVVFAEDTINVYTYATTVSAMTEQAFADAQAAGNYGTSLSANGIKAITYDSVNGSKWAYNNHAAKGLNMTFDGTDASGRLMVNVEYRNVAAAFLALKLKVEEAGVYDLEIGAIGHPNSCVADVYLFPAGEIAKVTLADLAGKTPINEANSYSTSTSSKVTNNKSLSMGDVHLETAGDYYIVLNFKENTNGQSTDAYPRQYFYLREIKLTEKPVSSIVFKEESVSIDKGEEALISAIANDSNGNALSEAIITYESENEDIATVDASTGKVTGVGDGTTNVVAKVAGYDITAKIPVTVRDYTHVYVFGSSVFTEETKTYLGDNLASGALRNLSLIADDYKYVDETKTDLWAFSSFGSTSGNIVGDKFNMGIKLSSVGYDTPSSRFVLKLKVKYPGIYDLGIGSGTIRDRALCADVYMIKAEGITALSNEIIRSNKKLGSINALVGSSADDVLGTINLEAGDYYLVFDLWNDMVVGADKHNIYPMSAKLTLHEGEIVEEDNSVALENKKLSFSLGSTDTAEITVNGNVHSGNSVYRFDRGEEVTVEAGVAPEGKRFKAWVQGTEDNGTWKSGDEKYTFNIMTHTYLTAVYEDIPAEDAYVVEYYNENGKYYATKEANGETPVLPENPKLTGYTFGMWTLDGETKFDETSVLTKKLTQAVAKYTANDITANNVVKYNGQDKTAKFGSEISLSDAKATHWLRDGKVVAYGTDYTHYIWDGTSIYCSYAPVEKNPVVVIEKTLVDGANMIEYDAGNKKIVEVGILFGTANVEIGSCRYKATSQWNKNHGQFTASRNSDEGYARGYLIYEDAGVYKVIYTDAVEIK